MSNLIKVDFTAIEEATDNLVQLTTLLESKQGMKFDNADDTKGKTYDSLNNALNELNNINKSMDMLINKTKSIIENAGISFRSADEVAASYYKNIGE